MDIGAILSRAWQTVWKHKILWIFGLLAGLTSAGSSAFSNSGYRFSSGDVDGFYFNLTGWEWGIIALILLCLGLIFFFLVIFLGAIGRIGLVRGTQLVDRGQEKLSFGQLFNDSTPYFWRVFGLILIVPALIFFGVLIIGIPLSIITCGIGAIAMIIALMLLPVLIELSVIAIVVEDVGVLDGLKRGWDVFRHNLGTMILMWLILVVGLGIVVVAFIGIPIALFLTPLAVTTSFGTTPQASNAGTILSILCLLAFIPVLLVIAGIIRSFITSAWTLTYLELTGQSSKPVIVPTPLEPLEPQLPVEPETPQLPEEPEEPEEPLPPPL